MSYILSIAAAAKTGEVMLSDNTIIERGRNVTVSDLSTDMLAAYTAGLISINPAPPTFVQQSKISITDNTGGVAPTVSNSSVTIPIVTDIASAAAAIKALINIIKLMNLDHTTTLTQMTALQTQLASLSKKITLKLG